MDWSRDYSLNPLYNSSNESSKGSADIDINTSSQPGQLARIIILNGKGFSNRLGSTWYSHVSFLHSKRA